MPGRIIQHLSAISQPLNFLDAPWVPLQPKSASCEVYFRAKKAHEEAESGLEKTSRRRAGHVWTMEGHDVPGSRCKLNVILCLKSSSVGYISTVGM